MQLQLKSYRQSVLKHAFEGKLTEAYRNQQSQTLPPAQELLNAIRQERKDRHQQALKNWQQEVIRWAEAGKHGKKPGKPKAPKELPPLTDEEIEKLPALPEGWMWIYFGELLDSIKAGKSFKCEERPPQEDEIGVAKVSAVSWGEYNELESKTCVAEDKINNSFLIKSGDFLFSRANTIELVGSCVIVKNTKLQVMLSDKTLRLNFIKDRKSFALHYLRSFYGRKEIELLATGNQDSMRNIGQDRIKQIKVPLPPLEEQHQIVQEIESRLSVAEHLEKTVEESLRQAEVLRQSILQRAFTGQLVPQDPNDEPAVELLKRIQEEKSGGKKKAVEAKASGMQTDEQLSITF